MRVGMAMAAHHLAAVFNRPVHDVVDHTIYAIVTDGDLRRTTERTSPDAFSSLTAQTMMTSGPITASPEMLAYDALRLLEDRPSQTSALPVTDEQGRRVALLRLHDVVRSGFSH